MTFKYKKQGKSWHKKLYYLQRNILSVYEHSVKVSSIGHKSVHVETSAQHL